MVRAPQRLTKKPNSSDPAAPPMEIAMPTVWLLALLMPASSSSVGVHELMK